MDFDKPVTSVQEAPKQKTPEEIAAMAGGLEPTSLDGENAKQGVQADVKLWNDQQQNFEQEFGKQVIDDVFSSVRAQAARVREGGKYFPGESLSAQLEKLRQEKINNAGFEAVAQQLNLEKSAMIAEDEKKAADLAGKIRSGAIGLGNAVSMGEDPLAVMGEEIKQAQEKVATEAYAKSGWEGDDAERGVVDDVKLWNSIGKTAIEEEFGKDTADEIFTSIKNQAENVRKWKGRYYPEKSLSAQLEKLRQEKVGNAQFETI